MKEVSVQTGGVHPLIASPQQYVLQRGRRRSGSR